MYVAISSGASPSKSNLNVTILWLWVSSWHSTILSPVLHTCMQRLTTLIPGKAKGTLKLPSNRLYLHLIWSVWVCWTSPGANEHAWISYASSKTFLLAFHFLLLLQSCRSSLYQKQHLDSCSLARERKNNPKIKPESHAMESRITGKLRKRGCEKGHICTFFGPNWVNWKILSEWRALFHIRHILWLQHLPRNDLLMFLAVTQQKSHHSEYIPTSPNPFTSGVLTVPLWTAQVLSFLRWSFLSSCLSALPAEGQTGQVCWRGRKREVPHSCTYTKARMLHPN